MKKMALICSLLLLISSFWSCNKDLVEYSQGDIKVKIVEGDEWLHDFPLFLSINKKNPPQVAIWLEDTNGNYLTTIYASYKIAHQAWQNANGNRRKEALPCWCYARGVKYADGLYLPTKDQPLTDAMSGATPHEGFDVKITPNSNLKKFIVKVELNHSIDFNDSYPKSAKEGDTNYSGGKEGSGQPALVYEAMVDLTTGQKTFNAQLIGHSSPDGASGTIYKDMSGITTALKIVKQITVTVQ